MKHIVLALSVTGLFLYAGCSSDDTVSKAPSSTTDSGAAVDSGTATDSGAKPVDSGSTVTDTGTAADTGSSSACQSYCSCMAATCASKAPANCLTACAAQTTWDLNCRTQHCGLASSDPTTHCVHAAGESTCQ